MTESKKKNKTIIKKMANAVKEGSASEIMQSNGKAIKTT